MCHDRGKNSWNPQVYRHLPSLNASIFLVFNYCKYLRLNEYRKVKQYHSLFVFFSIFVQNNLSAGNTDLVSPLSESEIEFVFTAMFKIF